MSLVGRAIYPDLTESLNLGVGDWLFYLREWAILSACSADVDDVKGKVLATLLSEKEEYRSNDQVFNELFQVDRQIPINCFNTVTLLDLTLHLTKLKVGCSVLRKAQLF
jgi:hypothetical protein